MYMYLGVRAFRLFGISVSWYLIFLKVQWQNVTTFMCFCYTGQLLQSFRIPAVAEAQGFRILIISMQIIPYADDGLLVISNLTRQHRTGHTLSTVKSELWRIKYRAPGFLSKLR